MSDMYRVRIRRDLAEVRSEAEQVDGKVFGFIVGWIIEEDDSDIYVGEKAMIPRDQNYPESAPTWIASGDLHKCHPTDSGQGETK